MNKKIITVFVYIVSVTISFFIFAALFSGLERNKVKETIEGNRLIIESDIILEEEFLATIREQVYRGMSMKRNNSSFFISDFSDYTIKQFNFDGELIGIFGQGQGRGPGEFQNITDFSPVQNYIWAVDMNNSTITRFSLDTGEHDLIINTDGRMPSRVAANDDLIAVKWLMGDKFFSVYSSMGEELHRFGTISDDQLTNPFAYDGWLEVSDTHLFFLPMNFGKIFIYDLVEGTLIAEIDTPDLLQPPEHQERVNQGQRFIMAPTSQYNNRGMIYLEESHTLLVHTYYRGKEIGNGEYDNETAEFWLDMYNLDQMEYQKSVKVPHALSAFFIRENLLYTYNTTSAVALVYRLEKSAVELFN